MQLVIVQVGSLDHKLHPSEKVIEKYEDKFRKALACGKGVVAVGPEVSNVYVVSSDDEDVQVKVKEIERNDQ